MKALLLLICSSSALAGQVEVEILTVSHQRHRKWFSEDHIQTNVHSNIRGRLAMSFNGVSRADTKLLFTPEHAGQIGPALATEAIDQADNLERSIEISRERLAAYGYPAVAVTMAISGSLYSIVYMTGEDNGLTRILSKMLADSFYFNGLPVTAILLLKLEQRPLLLKVFEVRSLNYPGADFVGGTELQKIIWEYVNSDLRSFICENNLSKD
jgi:hypothetical protein